MCDLNPIAKTPIRSEFAMEADFREVLESFVEALPERCRLLSELHQIGSLDELGRQAHQLKGAGGGYGFPEISAAGAELQHACRAQDAMRIQQRLAELIGILGRVEA
ncbi:MAG TPA: Hpt domain-containing protein [Planctomycetaceae bacterium]|jgi:HPt (histidine-containing phosphotransfer) domain-containing protein|nr:Hpt domain-containing protein [Planctomycetaceae bacterium]